MLSLKTLRLYPFLKLAVALILGMWLASSVDILLPWQWAVCLVVMVVVAFLVRRPLPQSLLLLLSVFLMGATLMSRQLADMGDGYAADETVFDAVVTSQPVMRKKVMQMDLWITSASRPFKVRASIFRDDRAEQLKVGHGIRARGTFEKPSNYMKSTFDYRTYLLRHGYRSTVFLYISDWQLQHVSLLPLSRLQRTRLAFMQLRQQLTARYRSLGLSGDQLAVVSAMTLGDRSMLSSALKDDYSISGGAHILALSGMHLGIIYMVLTLVLGVRRHRNSWRFFFSSMLLMAAIWSFVLLVGMSPSVVRAAVMLSLLMFVQLLNRRAVSLNTLAFTACLILVIHPMALFDVGFQLSYASVAAILIFYQPIYRLLCSNSKEGLTFPIRLGRMLWGTLSVSLAAQLGVAPLIAHYFGRIPVYFLFTNLAVLLLATLILYCALGLWAFVWLPPVQSFFAKLLSLFTEGLNVTLHQIAALPCASIEPVSLNAIGVVACYVFLLSLYFIYLILRKPDITFK